MSSGGFKEIPLTQGRVAFVDEADYLALSAYRWCVNSGGYAVRGRRRTDEPGPPLVIMHRVITDAPVGFQVDHINHDKLDNRRPNLRVCTAAENARNKPLVSSNTIGFKGVAALPDAGRYVAKLRAEGALYTSRHFATAIGAALAYDAMAREFHGEFAGLNFPDFVMDWPWSPAVEARALPGVRKLVRDTNGVIRRVQDPAAADVLLRELAQADPEAIDAAEIIARARQAVFQAPRMTRAA